MLAVLIMLLNIGDALFTLRHIENGASELNPIMGYALGLGPVLFIVIKHLLVGIGLVTAVYKARQFRWTKPALIGVSALYGAVVVYHTVLWIIV